MDGSLPVIRSAEFEVLREAIHQVTGISLSEGKRTLVQTRLAKRLKQLGLADFAAYVEHLRANSSAERAALVRAMTTHTTHFWREAHHFEELVSLVLAPAARANQRTLRLWSAASSTGEEAYSMAITAAEHLDLHRCDVKILATDIEPEVLERAEAGLYPESVADVRPELRGYFEPQEDEQVRVRADVRSLVRFRQLNLVAPNWPVRPVFDAIFIRNVLIYFNEASQLQVVRRLATYLTPRGVLVLGHAESMLGIRAGLRPVGRGVFSREPR